MGAALVLALLVAPEDANQGISQRIFYVHVPIALTAYFCFGLGAVKALLLLWRGDSRHDLESYVAVHQGTIFGALTLVTLPEMEKRLERPEPEAEVGRQRNRHVDVEDPLRDSLVRILRRNDEGEDERETHGERSEPGETWQAAK